MRDASGAFSCGKHTENMRKIEENMRKIEENARKIGEFPRNSFLNLLPDDPFSRSFPVVFAVIFGENRRISEKIGEFRRKMENIGEFSGIFTEIIPFDSV